VLPVVHGARRFFKENGDSEVRRIYGVAAAGALLLLPLGALKGDLPDAVAVAFVLEVALGVLYVLFCVSNRQAANHRATRIMAARVQAQMIRERPFSGGHGITRLSCN
jgi:hypothetical protein